MQPLFEQFNDLFVFVFFRDRDRFNRILWPLRVRRSFESFKLSRKMVFGFSSQLVMPHIHAFMAAVCYALCLSTHLSVSL